MADAKRTVDVAINVTGTNTEQLTKLADSFASIGKAVQTVSDTVNTLKTNLDSLQVPKGLTDIVNGVKELAGIKVPNIKQIAQGFERLSAIKTPPDLGEFADEVKKFSGIKVPNIKNLAQGLERLTASTLDMQSVGSRLRIIYRNLKRFSDISVPNIKDIAKGLEELNKVAGINVQAKSLNTLADVLQKLNGLKAPSLAPLINGLKKLVDVNIGESSKKLSQLASVLNQFGDRKLPSVTGLVNGLKKLVDVNVGAVAKKIRELNGAIKALDQGGYLKNFASFASDLNKISNSLTRTGKALDGYNVRVKEATKNTKGFGERVKNYFQYRIIADAVIHIKEAIIGAFNAIKDYDQALKDLQAITGATGLEVEQMGATIKEVASTTKFSAQEVAEGMRTLGQAGFTASEAIQTMQAVSDLATGTLSDMSTTVDLVTTAMRVFKIDASESGIVADTFANAVNRSKLTIDKLRTAMNYVGPIAKEAGVSFQEMSASMMTLANSGLRASTIGTGLRKVFAELVDPSDKLAAAAREAGIALGDLDPQTRGLAEVINNLGLVVNDTQTAFDIFGKRGAAAVLALSDTEGQFNSMLETVSRSGTAAKMAGTQMEGLWVQFKNLQDKIGLLAIAIGKIGITDALRVIISVSRDVVDAITAIVNTGFVKFIGKSAILVGSIWTIHKAFLAIRALNIGSMFAGAIAGLGSMTGAAVASETALNGLLLALNPLVVVLALLAAGAVYAFASLDSAKEAAKDAAILADEYGALGKVFENYRVKTASMKEGSKKLADANKDLRTKLLETASGMTDISDEALKAASSINPLNGEIIDGGKALAAYDKELSNLTFEQLVKSAQAAEENVAKQASGTNRFLNRWKDAFTQVGTLGVGLGDSLVATFDAIFDGDFSKVGDIVSKTLEKTTEYGARVQEALAFSDLIDDGKASFQDFSDYVNSLNFANLTNQEQDLVDAFNLLSERSNALFKDLMNTSKVDLNDTIENIREIAEKAGIAGMELEAVMTRITNLKKATAESTTNIIEKWGKDAKASKQSVSDFVSVYQEMGGKISAEQIAQIQASQKQKDILVSQLATAKEVRDKAIANKQDETKAYEQYYDTVDALVKKAKDTRKADAENEVYQVISNLVKITEAHEKNVAEINAKYKGKANLLVRYLREAEAEFLSTRDKLIKGVLDPQALVADTKVTVKEIQASYQTMYKEIELAALHEGANKKALNAKKRALEKEEAEKIKDIWIDIDEKINEGTGPESNSGRAARKAKLDAQIADGKISAENAKKIAEEEAQAQENAYETASAKRETQHSVLLAKIASAETNGTITHEQAEQAKLQASLNYYDQAWQKAQEYLAKTDKGQNPKEYKKRLDALLTAEKKYYNEKKKYVEDYNKEVESLNKNLEKKDDNREKKVRSHNQKLFTLDKKYKKKREKIHDDYIEKKEDADEDYADDLEKIEKDLADTIKDINDELADDLEDINDDRIQNAKDLNAAIAGIEEDTADKIRKVNQRGMSDKQKDRDNERAAYTKLAKAKKMQQEAERTGNKELAKQAEDMIGQVQDLAGEFDNANKAKSLLYRSEDALKANATIQTTIDNLELEKKAVEAIEKAEKKKKEAREEAAYDKAKAEEAHNKELSNIEEWKTEKLKAAKEANDEALRLENQRHSNEMTDLDKEIVKLREKLEVAKEVANAASSDVLGDAEEQTAGTDSQGGTSYTGDNVLTKSLEASKEAIKAMGEQYKVTASDIKQQQQEIAENGYRVIEVNGKKMFTNLTDDQMKATEMFADAAQAAGDSMTGIGDSGKAEFQKVYDEYGRLVEITSQGISITFTDPKNVPNLKEQIQQEMEVELRVNRMMDKVKNHIDELQSKMKSIGDTGTGLKIMGPDQIAQVNEVADQISKLFDGLNTDDPKQKLQDMLTTMKGMGSMNEDTFRAMEEDILAYAATVEDADVKLVEAFKNGRAEVYSTSEVIDEAGNKIEGLSDKIQSNPLELFSDSANEEIVKEIENIEGAVDHLQERVKEETELHVEAKRAEEEVNKVLEEFDTLKEDIESRPITPVVELDESGAKAVQDEVEKAKDAVEKEPVEIKIEADTEEVNTEVTQTVEELDGKEITVVAKADKTEVEEFETWLDDTTGESQEITITALVDNAEFEAFAEELDELISQSPVDVKVQVQVQGTADMRTLLEWLEQLDDHNPKDIDVTAEVTGHDEVVALKQAIDSLINKTVRIIADVTGIDKVKALKNAIDDLKDKTITITTRYVTIGKPPAEAKASGGEVQGFNSGGSVFRKLASPFINKGTGNKDDVPAMLMKGEFVQRVAAVRKYGKRFMEMVNTGSYPIELARKAVPHFAVGGPVQFDWDSSSVVQNFSRGGAVLSGVIGSLRKKLFDLFGEEAGANLNVDSVNFQNVVDVSAKNLSTELGTASIIKMTEAFSDTVQEFYRGGPVREIDTSRFDSTISGINNVYDDMIRAATASGGFKRAAILEKERLALLNISEELKAKILALTEDYNEDVADAESDHDETLADAKERYDESVEDRDERHDEIIADNQESYDESVEDKNESYNDSVEDDQEEYDDAKELYDENSADNLEDYNESKDNIEDEYKNRYHELWSDMIDARADAREAVKEVNDLGRLFGSQYSNGKVYNTYPFENWDIPNWDDLKSTVDWYWVRQDVSYDTRQKNKEKALESAAQKWSTWLQAVQSLEDLGIENTSGVVGGTVDLESLALNLSSAEKKSELNEAKEKYDEAKADYDENWSEYKSDHAEDVSERDEDHREALADYLEDFNETKRDENESYAEDLADYLERYSDSVKDADESLSDALQSLLESYEDSIESENASSEDSAETKKEETQKELSDLKDKLATEGVSERDATSISEVIEGEATASKRSLSIEELLKRLGRGLFSFNTGGSVPHTSFSIPGKDSIMAALTPGEYVMKEGVVSHFGAGFFEALNNFRIPGFNEGGVVGTIAADFQKTIVSSEVRHALELSVNGTVHEPLYGSQTGIDDIINSLEMAKMRS